MFDNILNLFKKKWNKDENKNTAKERLHLVLMQDRANVSADFLDLMRHEIIEVIKKYIDVDENSIDVLLVDEAHRIQKKAYTQYTKQEMRTELPQIDTIIRSLSIIYLFAVSLRSVLSFVFSR